MDCMALADERSLRQRVRGLSIESSEITKFTEMEIKNAVWANIDASERSKSNATRSSSPELSVSLPDSSGGRSDMVARTTMMNASSSCKAKRSLQTSLYRRASIVAASWSVQAACNRRRPSSGLLVGSRSICTSWSTSSTMSLCALSAILVAYTFSELRRRRAYVLNARIRSVYACEYVPCILGCDSIFGSKLQASAKSRVASHSAVSVTCSGVASLNLSPPSKVDISLPSSANAIAL
mmetsp:Transcript_31221/g.92757  ORF Transcript_31221/g.92757 Transcript_31221/m.92757 type:complete len:238 (-) Transcript_31221:711-1424(-)